MGDRPEHTEPTPRFVPVADHALLVEFGDEIDETTSQAVLALDRALAGAAIDGVAEIVPAYVNLLVDFDPTITDHAAVERAVRALVTAPATLATTPNTRRVQVCYEPPFAPDLETVSEVCGLSVQATVDAHLAGDYRVAMYGFAPGCAYLAGVPETIRVPRKPAPIRGIAAGSVIIAGPQCMVTTIETPTGWSIIGRSPTPILLDEPGRPFLFDVGDRVEFERIDLSTHEQLARAQRSDDTRAGGEDAP